MSTLGVSAHRLGVEPDRNASGLGHGDGGAAARAAVSDKSYAPVCPARDHLGVAPVPGGVAIQPPVGRPAFELVAGRAGSVAGGDRVGSARACSMDKDYPFRVASEDHGQACSTALVSSQVRLPVTSKRKGSGIIGS